MKKIYFYVRALKSSVLCFGLAFACMLTMYSCDNEDDDEEDPTGLFQGSLADAPYEADAVKYVVTGNTEIGSIELTSSGNYLILSPEIDINSAQSNACLASKTVLFLKRQVKPLSRYVPTNGCLFGTFTKNTDGSYVLKNYGTIRETNDTQLQLVKTNGGQSTTLTVQKQPTITANSLNNRLCRTWNPVGVDSKYYDAKGTLLHSEYIEGAELQENFVNYVVVSKSGSFFQVEYDGSMAGYGSWKWTDTEKQVFEFQWLDEDYPDGGSEQVSFYDDTVYFEMSYTDTDDNGQTVKIVEIARCKALN